MVVVGCCQLSVIAVTILALFVAHGTTSNSTGDIMSITCNGHGEEICSCICDENFEGDSCEIEKQVKTDYCNSLLVGMDGVRIGDQCKPNGICVNTINGAKCKCLPGFYGSFCQRAIRVVIYGGITKDYSYHSYHNGYMYDKNRELNTEIYFPGVPLRNRYSNIHMKHRTNHSTAIIGKKIFIAGGITGERERRYDDTYNNDFLVSNELEIFDMIQNKWIEGPPMKYRRSGATSGGIDHKMYICGGVNGRPHNNCEVYDVEINEWNEIAPMHFSRKAAAGAVLDNKFYVMGGLRSYPDTQPGGGMVNVERYDPKTNTWEDLENLMESKSYAAAAPLGDHVMICGGCPYLFTECEQNSCQKYSPLTNKWYAINSTLVGSYGSAMVSFGDYVWLLGGSKSHQRISRVELYDQTTDKWKSVANMASERATFSAVIVHE